MTWRVGKVSVSTSTAAVNTWRIANISAGTPANTWRLGNISVTTAAAVSTWRIAKASIATTGGWRIANISCTTSQATTPAVTPLVSQTIDPVVPYGVVATVSNGATPDSWTWHLGTTSGGSDLDSLLTVSGAVASFAPPGSSTGSTVYLTVTATKGGNTSVPQTATLPINPTPYFYLASDGTLKPMSLPIYLKG